MMPSPVSPSRSGDRLQETGRRPFVVLFGLHRRRERVADWNPGREGMRSDASGAAPPAGVDGEGSGTTGSSAARARTG